MNVIKIDGQGQEEIILSDEFDITNFDNLDSGQFKLIKYLDPYGNSTFGGDRTQPNYRRCPGMVRISSLFTPFFLDTFSVSFPKFHVSASTPSRLGCLVI